jgi:hypothetical protein
LSLSILLPTIVLAAKQESGFLASRRCVLGGPGLLELLPELVVGDSFALLDLLVGLLKNGAQGAHPAQG